VTSSTLWSAPEVVSEMTTSDRDPALATAGEVPHLVFSKNSNVFAGNSEIYYQIGDGKAWSLPVNVSRTQGVSTDPTLALGSDGVLHATWSDTTSGYSVIYYGRRVLGTTF
jgi:hypothetical protein